MDKNVKQKYISLPMLANFIGMLFSLFGIVLLTVQGIKEGFNSELIGSFITMISLFLGFLLFLISRIPVIKKWLLIKFNNNKQFEFNYYANFIYVEVVDFKYFMSDEFLEKLRKLKMNVVVKWDGIDNVIDYYLEPFDDLTFSIKFILEENCINLIFSNMVSSNKTLDFKLERINRIINTYKNNISLQDEFYNVRFKYEKNGNPYLKYYVNSSNIQTTINIKQEMILNNDMIQVNSYDSDELKKLINKYILNL